VFLILVYFITVEAGYACVCMPPRTVEEAIGKSSAVFIGTVTEIYRPFLARIGLTKSYDYRVRFEITKRWKGPVSKSMVVTTRLSTESCGFPFKVEREYLVYVVDQPPDIQAGICTGTKDIAEAEPEIQQLDNLAENSSQQPE
jgi:hypothetical protein